MSSTSSPSPGALAATDGATKLNVCEYLLANKDDRRCALETLQRSFTFGELRVSASAVAQYLAESGGQAGDRVILSAENDFFWAAAYLGILRAGLVCVPLPPNMPSAEVGSVLQMTEARFAFAQVRTAANNAALKALPLVVDLDPPAGAMLGHVQTLDGIIGAYSGQEREAHSTKANDLAALMFTSGSTGTPRGVMISHGNIVANTDSIIEYLELTDRDRVMTVLPFHYCFGTSLLHTHLRAGATLVIDRRFMFPEKVLQRMVETKCTGFAGVPSHYQILLRKSNLAKMSFPHLRYVQQAGGHLAPAFVRELCDALPTTKVYVMYGQTEATARLSYLPPTHLGKKLGSIGKGIPGVRLRVIGHSGEEVMPGEVGEIVAEGKNIALGYWCSEQDTAATFREGRLHTGDLATVDADGFIYIVDRAKDFIKCGGKRVSCRQIEETILELPLVVEAAVVGLPHEVLGEAVKLFVVPRTGAADGLEDEVREFCKQRLAPPLQPKEIVVLQSLPKNTAGKVSKSELKAKYPNSNSASA